MTERINGDFGLDGIVGSYLSYYVITDSVDIGRNYKDTGNIVILRDHPASSYLGENEYGNLEDEQYPGAYLYTDLYVGDEHIAGGYGFNSPLTRDRILNLPDELEKLKDDVNNLKQSSDQDNPGIDDPTTSDNRITVDNVYNIVDTGDKQFKLDFNKGTQQLSFFVTHKPTINDITLTYEIHNPITGDIYYYDQSKTEMEYNEVTRTHVYSYLVFDYEGNDDLSAFYMTYSFDVKGRTQNNSSIYDNDFIGTFYEPVPIIFNDPSPAYPVTFEDMVIVKDPNYHPDVVQRRIKVNFSGTIQDKFMENSHFEGIIRYRIHLITQNSTKVSKDVCRMAFTFPCFYSVGTNVPWDLINSNNSQWSSFIMTHDHDSQSITFRHFEETSLPEILLVPQRILGKTLDKKDIVCVLEQSGVRFEWDTSNGSGLVLGLNGDPAIIYYQLTSPHPYKGDVTWNFSIQ